jgi:hypothetical protein
MWFCEQDECLYDICNDCAYKREIRCRYGHLLKFSMEDFDCSFCDDWNYPCMICPGDNCKGSDDNSSFRICLKCCVSETKIKDRNGHPLSRNVQREFE